ncbi:MAG: aldo/keto reductase [Methanomicrobiales archaeon]|nr:aldo/keto reductase [Methanomicrobiales archaeon]
MERLRTCSLGRTGRTVSRIGLGGEGVLRTHGRAKEAFGVIQEAYRQGITYWDSARAYAGSEEYHGMYWEGHREERHQIFQTSKSARRDAAGALADLEKTLSNMNSVSLDLWQIHDIRTIEEIERIEGKGGALEAFVQAKERGRVSAIGVTGHHDPAVLARAIEAWSVDTVLLPVNPIEKTIGGFTDVVIPAARRRGMGVIGMKILGGGQFLDSEGGVTPDILVRYALSQDIDVAIVGCSTPAEVQALSAAGKSPPLTKKEQEILEEHFRPYAKKLAFYRGAI